MEEQIDMFAEAITCEIIRISEYLQEKLHERYLSKCKIRRIGNKKSVYFPLKENLKVGSLKVVKFFYKFLTTFTSHHFRDLILSNGQRFKVIIKILETLESNLMLSWVESIKLLEEYLLSYIPDPSQSSSCVNLLFLRYLCQVCNRYNCSLHLPLKIPSLTLQLFTAPEPLEIYSDDWKGRYLSNEYESRNSSLWFESYKCLAHSSTIQPPPSTLNNNLPFSLPHLPNSYCSLSLILNLPCAPFSVAPSLPLTHTPLKIANQPLYTTLKLLPYHNTSSNCRCSICSDSCPCLLGLIRSNNKIYQSRGYCERFCSCSYSCPYKFLGCDCTHGCRKETCVCFINNFECDTILCRSCGCAADITFGRNTCGNVRFQIGCRKRLAVGESRIKDAGLGVFAAEQIEEKEVVGEYTGEIISNKEADRRGSLYDYREHSFIFAIDEMCSIDATFYGGVLKYANHKPDRNANCDSQIWRVRGTTKVLIISKTQIHCGEEIYFDYKYPKTVPYEWYQNTLNYLTDDESYTCSISLFLLTKGFLTCKLLPLINGKFVKFDVTEYGLQIFFLSFSTSL